MPADLRQAAGEVQLSVVRYRREIVAVAGAERAYIAPRIAERPAGDPLLRFVAAMCLYARDIAAGHLPGRYDDDAAELYARCVLIPDEPFDALSRDSDVALAQRFQVPVDQVAAKRTDLARTTGGRAPGDGTYPRRGRRGR